MLLLLLMMFYRSEIIMPISLENKISLLQEVEYVYVSFTKYYDNSTVLILCFVLLY